MASTSLNPAEPTTTTAPDGTTTVIPGSVPTITITPTTTYPTTPYPSTLCQVSTVTVAQTATAQGPYPPPGSGVSIWAQCGGIDFVGTSAVCQSGSACVYLNPYYSQCQPSAVTSIVTICSGASTILAV
ncbi:carbohydrate-binding module family 1 protein [Hypholoma sublateritium FD-334 SS-4]|uniref:Carbohydrate-binding module family 1 protein n=1 Tax=Hypholoma sublateritium (strain FD-334 SS-4) TaxID=945553 RepID=A0A0D2MXE4_HYPSF|nr:carbohydrate-binding module family 1 protein [Hypholoma sublateritium FD-334 SS-4]